MVIVVAIGAFTVSVERRLLLVNVHLITVPLPWSTTLSTTLPAVSASLMAQADSDEIGCRVTVNGIVREEQSANGVNAQTYCLVKSA